MKTMNWTIVADPKALDTALALARGSYQRHLLQGTENLSGSTLRGKARSYAGRYAASRRNLLDRMRAAGVPAGERRGERGARLLVVGASS